MSWEDKIRKVEPYVAGEQPKEKNIIKLNTNECPYPPAPGVQAAVEQLAMWKPWPPSITSTRIRSLSA